VVVRCGMAEWQRSCTLTALPEPPRVHRRILGGPRRHLGGARPDLGSALVLGGPRLSLASGVRTGTGGGNDDAGGAGTSAAPVPDGGDEG
jgi:hypothetical protein